MKPTVKAPQCLSKDSRAIFRQVTAGWVLTEPQLVTLTEALTSLDRARQARRLIEREGLVLNGKLHPAANIERTSRQVFEKLWRALKLEGGHTRPPGRPPGAAWERMR